MTLCLVCCWWRATNGALCAACAGDLPADSSRRVSAAPHGGGVADGDGPGPDVDASSGRDRTPSGGWGA